MQMRLLMTRHVSVLRLLQCVSSLEQPKLRFKLEIIKRYSFFLVWNKVVRVFSVFFLILWKGATAAASEWNPCKLTAAVVRAQQTKGTREPFQVEKWSLALDDDSLRTSSKSLTIPLICSSQFLHRSSSRQAFSSAIWIWSMCDCDSLIRQMQMPLSG